jgi:predicted aspartyl protease
MTPQAPYPSLRIRYLIGGLHDEAFALVDTGFGGHLAVPEALLGQLPQPTYVHRDRTASGQVVRVPAYVGTVELRDQPGPIRAVVIVLGDEYLVGLRTVNHFKVTFDHGQRVIVEP